MTHPRSIERAPLFPLLLALLVAGACQEATFPEVRAAFEQEVGLRDNIDSYVTARVPEGYPGVALRVMRDDHVVIDKTWGVLRPGAPDRVSSDTPFFASQLAMQFTAASVLMLHERGLVSPDDLVSELLPDVPASWAEVTVHHLLTHRSGIVDYLEDLDIAEPGLTNDQVLEAVKAEALRTEEPGASFRFSHTGYVVLAEIIEEVAQQSFRSFVEEDIFAPLGLEHSYVVEEASPPVPGRAIGYHTLDQVWDYELRTLGDGGIYVSLSDLALWVQALQDHTLLTTESTATMYTDFDQGGHGYGWVIGSVGGHTAFYHDGVHRGFRGFVGQVPDLGIRIVGLASGPYGWFFELPGLIVMHELGA